MHQNSQRSGWPIVGLALVVMAAWLGAALVKHWQPRTRSTRPLTSADTRDQVLADAVDAMIDEGAPAGSRS